MANKSPYAGSTSLAYSVVLARRIKTLRAKGRKFTPRAALQWHEHQIRGEVADLMLPMLQGVQETIGRPAASWTPSERDFAEKCLVGMLRPHLYTAIRGRGRPPRKKIATGGIIRSRMLTPTKQRGRPPIITAATAQWWCRMVFMIKLGQLAFRKGYKDVEAALAIKTKLGVTITPSKVDAWIPTAWALEVAAEYVTDTTGAPPDPRTLAYIKRYYSRLRGRLPL